MQAVLPYFEPAEASPLLHFLFDSTSVLSSHLILGLAGNFQTEILHSHNLIHATCRVHFVLDL